MRPNAPKMCQERPGMNEQGASLAKISSKMSHNRVKVAPSWAKMVPRWPKIGATFFEAVLLAFVRASKDIT